MTAIIIGGGVEERKKAKVRGRFVRIPSRKVHYFEAEVVYDGRLYQARVNVGPTESEIAVMEITYQRLLKQAKAAQLTDTVTGERIA